MNEEVHWRGRQRTRSQPRDLPTMPIGSVCGHDKYGLHGSNPFPCTLVPASSRNDCRQARRAPRLSTSPLPGNTSILPLWEAQRPLTESRVLTGQATSVSTTSGRLDGVDRSNILSNNVNPDKEIEPPHDVVEGPDKLLREHLCWQHEFLRRETFESPCKATKSQEPVNQIKSLI